MGIAVNVGFNSFPKQGPHKDKPVQVCFHHDTSKLIDGVVVRDDYEEPWVTIIKLADGRFVLATECMYARWSSTEPPDAGNDTIQPGTNGQ